MGQKKGNEINYVAARTELSGKIARECVQGIAGGINSMYNNIYNGLLKESGYEKAGKKFTRPEWYGK